MPQRVSLVLLAGCTAFGLSFLLTPLVRSAAVRFGWIARPAHDRWGRRTIAPMPAASPSMLSKRLKAFMMSTNHNTEKGMVTQLSPEPSRMPPSTKRQPTTNCGISLA